MELFVKSRPPALLGFDLLSVFRNDSQVMLGRGLCFVGSGQVGECVSSRSTSALGGVYSRLPPRVRSVEEKIQPTSFRVETSCVVPWRFSVISPRSTGLSASLMVRLIVVFRTRHRWILVVAALFTLVSHSLTCLFSVYMEAGYPGWLVGGREFRDALIFLTRAEEVGCAGVVIVWWLVATSSSTTSVKSSMSAEDKESKSGRVDSHHRARGARESWCVERCCSVSLRTIFLLVVGVSQKWLGGDLRGVCDLVVV